MIKLRPIAVLLAGVVLAGVLFSKPASATVSFDFFHSNLSPHGRWMVSGSYGRVWQPAVYRPGWNPYYDGHWEETDVGNTWVSDYGWGAVPYHYGTWVFDPRYGWVWVPGYTWAPSWVVFRTGPDYIGWAPVRPNFTVGVTIVAGDYEPDRFVFVPCRSFFEPRVRTVIVPASQTTVIINKTKIVNKSITIENNTVVNRGLSVTELRRVTGRPVKPVPLERVRGLGPKVKREEIRLDAAKVKQGVRAAEPVNARTTVTKGHGRAERPDRSSQPERREVRERRSDATSVHDETAQVRRERVDVKAQDAHRQRDEGSHPVATNKTSKVEREPVSRGGDKTAQPAAARRGDGRADTGATQAKDRRDTVRERTKVKPKEKEKEKEKEKTEAQKDPR